MDIIVPCAGLSSRFPNMRPKYLLTEYTGKLMVYKALENLLDHNLHIIILKEHDEKYGSYEILTEAFRGKANIIVLDTPTKGPAETVYRALEATGITQPFLVRDCDSFFNFDFADGNAVYTSKLYNSPNLKNVSALGYVVSNEQKIISNLVEKKIVSDSFCVGGYQFADPEKFKGAYHKLQNQNKELFISNIIDYLILNGEIFVESEVSNYINVGTLDAWQEYNDRPVILCDVDGVVVKNMSAYGKNSYTKAKYKPLQKNIDVLKSYLNKGSKIIFITARSNDYYTETRHMLNDLGFMNCELIMNLHHSKRILINDFSNTNPYPSSVAVNIERDADNLEVYL